MAMSEFNNCIKNYILDGTEENDFKNNYKNIEKVQKTEGNTLI